MIKTLTWAMRVLFLCAAIRLYQLDTKFAILLVCVYALFAIMRVIAAYNEYRRKKEENDDAH